MAATLTTQERDALITQVAQKVASLPEEYLSEQQVRDISRSVLEAALRDENHEVFRKLGFPEQTVEPKLKGSKFAYHGLTRGDLEFLHDLQVVAYQRPLAGGHIGRGPSEELQNAFKAISRSTYMPEEDAKGLVNIDEQFQEHLDYRLPALLSNKQGEDLLRAEGWGWLIDRERRLLEAEAEERTLDTQSTGFGSELVGAEYVGQLWDGARQMSQVFANIMTMEMMYPTTYQPVSADIPEMMFVPERTTDIADANRYATSNSGSNRVRLDAKKFVIHQQWSGEMEEDAIIPFIAYIRRQAVESLAHYMDSLVINGDVETGSTGNINSDDGAPSATKHFLAFDGVRKVGLVDNTDNGMDLGGRAVGWSDLQRVRRLMLAKQYLHNWGTPRAARNLLYVCDPETAIELTLLDEVLGMDKIGRRTPLLTGQLGMVGPYPVLSSMAVPKTEADGKVSITDGNNTRGQIVVMNTRGFKFGWRRRVRTEVDREPTMDQNVIITSLRGGFARYSPTGADAGIEAAATIFNIDLPDF